MKHFCPVECFNLNGKVNLPEGATENHITLYYIIKGQNSNSQRYIQIGSGGYFSIDFYKGLEYEFEARFYNEKTGKIYVADKYILTDQNIDKEIELFLKLKD